MLAIEQCLNSTDFRDIERLNKHPSTLEDVYACLSILCEQQEIVQNEDEFKKIKMELGIEPSIRNFPEIKILQPELSTFNKDQRLAAEDKLQSMMRPFDCKSADAIIIKEICEATSHRLPAEFAAKIVEYDNPFRHRLFGAKKTLQQATLEACEIDERLLQQLIR